MIFVDLPRKMMMIDSDGRTAFGQLVGCKSIDCAIG
jgi:hypothetical protein